MGRDMAAMTDSLPPLRRCSASVDATSCAIHDPKKAAGERRKGAVGEAPFLAQRVETINCRRIWSSGAPPPLQLLTAALGSR